MMKVGDRVAVRQVWDAEATDDASGRHVSIGDVGTVIERDRWDDGAYVAWDDGGRCFMCEDEVVQAPKIVVIEYVDYGAQGEYGLFGKVVARSDTRGMTAQERAREIAEMRAILGVHIETRAIEEIPAVREVN